MELTELIAQAPWREAKTYRETWPHEYVVIKKDGQQELLAAVCKRICAGEGVDGRFFPLKNKYLFIGDYKYWLMTPCTDIDLKKDDYVLNRAPIYRDRRDFLIRDGDNGRRDKELDGIFGISLSEYYTKGGEHMTTEDLGKLENVPVKDVWLREDSDFTPWLAKNLSSLGEALDMKLELVQTEAMTGAYYLDILAEDANSGALVAIENQLEWTNDSHLGQVLTYAGWLDARVLIWVAPHFTEEHRAALEWLNRWTPEVIQVFGVEFHTTKKSDSEADVQFVPVVFPASWSISDGSKPTPAKIQRFVLREVFQQLIDDLHHKDPECFPHSKAYARNYQDFPSGVSDITYRASFERSKVWVYIPGWMTDKRILESLRQNKQAIEAELNLSSHTGLQWSTGAGSIGVYRDGTMYDSEEELEKIRQWMFDYLLKFKKVFNPRIDAIIAQKGEAEEAD